MDEIDPDDLREQLEPDEDGRLTVAELRYLIREELGRSTDYRPLRRGDLSAAVEVCAGSEPDGDETVAELRDTLVDALGGVTADAHEAATPLTRDALVALLENLR